MSSFDGASLNDLRAMIANADPGGLDAVASKWSAVYEALRQAQQDLLHHTLAATTHWQGAAADAFSARADELHQSLGNGAAYAFNASSGVSYAAESLRTAQAAMPAGALTLEGIGAAQQATAAGVTATQFDEHQRQQASAVMRRLEHGYAAAGEMIGTPRRTVISSDRGAFLARNSNISPQEPRIATFQNHANENLTHSPTKAISIQPTGGSPNGTENRVSNSSMPPPSELSAEAATEPEGQSSPCSYYSRNKGTPVDRLANQSTFNTVQRACITTSQMSQAERPKPSVADQASSSIEAMRKFPSETEGFGPAQLPKAPHRLPQGTAIRREPASWKGTDRGDVRNIQQATRIGEIKPPQFANGDPPANSMEQSGTLPSPLSISGRSIERRRAKTRRPAFLTQDAEEWIGSCPPANPSAIDY